MKIFQLPDSLANKIAAGEVVERPASVVKELVENSIDASSTSIKIEVTEAGLDMIKITDDGHGMSASNCERSFLRHATSKIKSETDLFHVNTLGFRGEALASIAAVSRLTMKTSQGNEAGTLLTLEGGKVKNIQKSDARKGTEIVVKDLFFNTPARLKYMKTIHTELGHITDLLNRLALAHPSIRFEALHNGRQLFSTSGSGDVLQVISRIYGMNVAKNMLPVEAETIDFKLSGYIAKPDVTRASRNFISTIINGRYIRNIGLARAISRAYHTLLPIHRQPIVVLMIEMDPILVDVNVHPTKLEVRFSKEKELFQTVEKMIRSALRKTTLIPEIEQTEAIQDESIQHTIAFETPINRPPTHTIYEDNKDLTTNIKRLDDEAEINQEQTSEKHKEINQTNIEKTATNQKVPTLYPIGQLQGTYIVAQNENGLYMIDQHAAQERIKYEEFRERLAQPMKYSQDLLLPITFEFSKQEAIFIEQYKDKLAHVGLAFEPFGHQSYVIRSYPTWFPDGFEEEIIREMVDQIMDTQSIQIEKIREEAAIMMACKGSIKANHYLNEDDMTTLLADLNKTTDPFTCPHGRPVIVHFSTYELEKMFKRVM